MGEVHNPEAVLFEEIEALEIEARELIRKRDTQAVMATRSVIDDQILEIERQVRILQRQLRR